MSAKFYISVSNFHAFLFHQVHKKTKDIPARKKKSSSKSKHSTNKDTSPAIVVEAVVEDTNETDDATVEIINENNVTKGKKIVRKDKKPIKKKESKKIKNIKTNECDEFSKHDLTILEKGYFTTSGRYHRRNCSKCNILFVTSKKEDGFFVCNKSVAYDYKHCDILLCSICHMSGISSNGRNRRRRK